MKGSRRACTEITKTHFTTISGIDQFDSMTPRLKAGRLDWGMNAAFKAQAITEPDDYPAEDPRLFFLALGPKP